MDPQPLRPFGRTATILLFGMPTLGLFGVYYGLMPVFLRAGWLPFYAYAAAFAPLFAGMIVAAMIGYRLENRPFTRHHFQSRFRLYGLTARDWLWSIGIFLATLALFLLLQPVTGWLIGSGVVPLPPNLPAFLDPAVEATAVLYDQAAGGVQGNWTFLLTSLLLLVLNVVGEELWWRGYILPRQEVASGESVWLLHGIGWTLFHAALWWNLLNLLPLTLGLVFVVSRRRNTTGGLLIHTLHKIDFFLVTIPLFLWGVS
jgi:membrane protease YdiL (CAAX protease family)